MNTLVPYEVPAQDADLLDCGVVLTEDRLTLVFRYNLVSTPWPPLVMGERQRERAELSARLRRIGRMRWLRSVQQWLRDPKRRASALRLLDGARERWGEADFASIAAEIGGLE